MTGRDGRGDDSNWYATLLDESTPGDAEVLRTLRADPAVTVLDHAAAQQADLARTRPAPPPAATTWAYYPWRRTLVALLERDAFRRLRLDRNRNKLTRAEQERLGRLRVGVVGLSVGHAVAHTLALEGLCGELRLADFDEIELSNLNRVPATVFDLGVNKAVVAARRIAEIDPYLTTTVRPDGVTAATLPAFLEGLDVVVEECDSLDLKVLVREEARRRGIPVLMETSDRGLLDVERFDLDRHRPLFHGLLGDVDSSRLAGLTTAEKTPHVLRILGASHLSARLAASMVEVGHTLTTWPQLGGDVAHGGAAIAAAIRRLGLGRELASGRVRIDLDEDLDALDPALAAPDGHADHDDHDDRDEPREDDDGVGAASIPAPRRADERSAVAMIAEAVRRAPSGGNVQPWRLETTGAEVRLHLDPDATTAMDVAHRGSYVALGAALYNARTAASAAGALGPVTLFPDPAAPDLVARLELGTGSDERLSADHPRVLRRGTNRGFGRPRPLTTTVATALHDAARLEGGRVHLVPPGEALAAAGEALGAADRVRHLTERLHREMFAEVVWPGAERTDVGIETRTLGLDAADLAKLAVARRPEVMAVLAGWDAGAALAEGTRDRVASSSALAVVTVDGATSIDHLRGGAAVEAVWVAAERHGLAVHPTSPVFLYAHDAADLRELSPEFSDELAALRSSFRRAVGVTEGESVALVLRLHHTDTAPPRSRRRPIAEISSST